MIFEIERAAGGRWRWLLVDGDRLVAVGGLVRTRTGARFAAWRARRAMACATVEPPPPRARSLGSDRLTQAQLDVIIDYEARRGLARVWEIPGGSVFVAAGDLVAVLEPEPSGNLVFDCGTGRAIEGLRRA